MEVHLLAGRVGAAVTHGASSPASAANIGAHQARLRTAIGIALVVAGIVLAIYFLATGADRWVRRWVFILFANGAVTCLEGRRSVCPFTAELGRENHQALLSVGGVRIYDRDRASPLRSVGRRLSLEGVLAGAVMTAVVLVLPPY